MEAKEAARIWGVSESYVRKTISQSPQKFPEGTVRKFGKQWVVTTEGMEHATGKKDPRKVLQSNCLLKYKRRGVKYSSKSIKKATLGEIPGWLFYFTHDIIFNISSEITSNFEPFDLY